MNTPTPAVMAELIDLLEGMQSNIGPVRPDPEDDEDDAELWDRIDRAIAALRSQPPAVMAELIAKWRNDAVIGVFTGGSGPAYREALRDCADELEAALRSQPDAQAVAYRLMLADGKPCPAFGKWVAAGYWESCPSIKPVLAPGAYYEYAYTHPASQPEGREAVDELCPKCSNYCSDSGIGCYTAAHQPSGEAVATVSGFRRGGDHDPIVDWEADVPVSIGMKLYARPQPVALPEGEKTCDGLLHPALLPHAQEWYRLCERRFTADRMGIGGSLAEAIVTAIACGCCQKAAPQPVAQKGGEAKPCDTK